MRVSEPEARAGEVGHARGAVVGDHARRRSARSAGRQVWVLAKTSTRASSKAASTQRAWRGIVEAVVREAPAGERGRVAVHDAHARLAHARDEVHRQRAQARAQRREAAARCRAGARGSRWSARPPRRSRRPDRRSRSPRPLSSPAISVSTLPRSAACAQHLARRRARTRRASTSNQWKSPLKTSAPAPGSRATSASDRLERLDVAVEAADHVERVGLDLGRAVERRGASSGTRPGRCARARVSMRRAQLRATHSRERPAAARALARGAAVAVVAHHDRVALEVARRARRTGAGAARPATASGRPSIWLKSQS